MSEVQRYGIGSGALIESPRHGQTTVVLASAYDQLAARERRKDEALIEATALAASQSAEIKRLQQEISFHRHKALELYDGLDAALESTP